MGIVHDPDVLDKLENIEARPWQGEVDRHMFADYPPDRENSRGARWNPPGVGTIYTSLERSTVLAEVRHRLDLDVVRPRVKRTIYDLRLSLHSVIDLRDRSILEELGLNDDVLNDDDYRACQGIGGAVSWLEHDGLLVPSIRYDGVNLVVYPVNFDEHAGFEQIGSERVG